MARADDSRRSATIDFRPYVEAFRVSFVDTVKDVLVPDDEPGVALECTDCGERFDEPLDHCPNCGSDDVKEVEGFDARPDT